MKTRGKHTIRALTVAGSDSGGGAGIQADLKTFSAYEVYGTSVITALTAQNTVGVQRVQYMDASFVHEQLNSVLDDIGTCALKSGMLGSVEIMEVVADHVERRRLSNYVIDPVMIAKGGERLIDTDAVSTVKQRLFPLASVVTPNIPEAEVLCGFPIESWDDCIRAAQVVHAMGPQTVIIKGGHAQAAWHEDRKYAHFNRFEMSAVDVLFDGKEFTYFVTPRVESHKTHGTGCTFSAAVTAALALDLTVIDAVASAKRFIYDAIDGAKGWDVGRGHGPTDHSVKPKFGSPLSPGAVYEFTDQDWITR